MRLISKLINGISSILQKLIATIISQFFVPQFPVEPIFFSLNLKGTLLPGKLATASSDKAG